MKNNSGASTPTPPAPNAIYGICSTTPATPAELATIREHGIEHNVYGHTDFGTFTLLMRQPVAALQVRPAGEEKWKWVKPLKHSITVNVADTLSFLTDG